MLKCTFVATLPTIKQGDSECEVIICFGTFTFIDDIERYNGFVSYITSLS